MLRKTILAIAAAATLGAAALSPTSASAWRGHPDWHGWYHGWAYRPAIRVFAAGVFLATYFLPKAPEIL